MGFDKILLFLRDLMEINFRNLPFRYIEVLEELEEGFINMKQLPALLILPKSADTIPSGTSNTLHRLFRIDIGLMFRPFTMEEKLQPGNVDEVAGNVIALLNKNKQLGSQGQNLVDGLRNFPTYRKATAVTPASSANRRDGAGGLRCHCVNISLEYLQLTDWSGYANCDTPGLAS